MKKLLLLMALAGVLPSFGMTEAINFSGRLVPKNGRAITGQTSLAMTFRLYAQAEGGTPLWGRRIPVVPSADGSFSIELSDEVGTVIQAAHSNLVSALAAASKDGLPLYVGLTPDDRDGSNLLEFKPRQRLATVPLAAVAAVTTQAKYARMDDLTVGGTLRVGGGQVADMVVSNGLPAFLTFVPESGSVLDCKCSALKVGNNYLRSKRQDRLSGWSSTPDFQWQYWCDTMSIIRIPHFYDRSSRPAGWAVRFVPAKTTFVWPMRGYTIQTIGGATHD